MNFEQFFFPPVSILFLADNNKARKRHENAANCKCNVKTAAKANLNYSISFAGPNKVELQFVRHTKFNFGENQKFSIQK